MIGVVRPEGKRQQRECFCFAAYQSVLGVVNLDVLLARVAQSDPHACRSLDVAPDDLRGHAL